MLLNGFKRLPVSRITSIKFFSIATSTRCSEKSNDDEWKKKYKVLSKEYMKIFDFIDEKTVSPVDNKKFKKIYQELLKENVCFDQQEGETLDTSIDEFIDETENKGRNIKSKHGRNEYLPRFFFEFNEKQDVIKDCQDVLMKVENRESELPPDAAYLYTKSIGELMKHQFIQDHHLIFEMYDRYFKFNMGDRSLYVHTLLDLIPTMYDPTCIDRLSGWKTTFENDLGFRESFVKEYGKKDMSELLQVVKGYMGESGMNIYGDEVLVKIIEYGKCRVESIDDFSIAEPTFHKTCIRALNNSTFLNSIKSTSDVDFETLSKKRCKDFFRNVVAQAMNEANKIEDQSISDVLRAQIAIDFMAKTITPRYQDEENLKSKWCKDYRSRFYFKSTFFPKELLEFPRILVCSSYKDTKAVFKYILENDRKAREMLTPHFSSNVVEDASDFAQELWDKISNDDSYKEDIDEKDFRGYSFINPRHFTETEAVFFVCCKYLICESDALKYR